LIKLNNYQLMSLRYLVGFLDDLNVGPWAMRNLLRVCIAFGIIVFLVTEAPSLVENAFNQLRGTAGDILPSIR
jgi:dihydroorotase-like cyclic amidohydrolase